MNGRRTVDMNEIRRLQKAARDNNIDKLVDWFKQFDEQLRAEYEREFEKELADAIDNYSVGIVYTLHFNENLRFGQKRIDDFIRDMMSTINMFSTGEYSPIDYMEILNKDGIHSFDNQLKERMEENARRKK